MANHNLNNLSDEELLSSFQLTLNQNYLATLFNRYTPLMFGVCLKYLENSALAEDAVLDLYEYLLNKIPEQNIVQFKSWLYVVTKNHCLMKLRKDKKTQIVNTEDFSFMQNTVNWHLDDELLQKEDLLNKLEQCLEKLNGEQRNVISLFYLKKMGYDEIVNKTGFEWNKVRSFIQNGRRNLKICLEN